MIALNSKGVYKDQRLSLYFNENGIFGKLWCKLMCLRTTTLPFFEVQIYFEHLYFSVLCPFGMICFTSLLYGVCPPMIQVWEIHLARQKNTKEKIQCHGPPADKKILAFSYD